MAEPSKQAALVIAARSDTGRKRAENEDFFAVDEPLGLFVVADGLGGHVAGRYASELGVTELVRAIRNGAPLEPPARLRASVMRANDALRQRASSDERLRGMGTTLAALWLRDGEAHIAHVGDSRLYLARDEKLHALSIDHSLVTHMIASGGLSERAARSHPSRHVITRAVGILGSVEPDVASLRTAPGDVYVLCSDGISGPIEDEEICAQLAEFNGELDASADALVRLANERGGDDNATVVLVGLPPLGPVLTRRAAG